MYVYRDNGHSGGYTVGYHQMKWKHDGTPYTEWQEESKHTTKKEAAARVNYLNGGTGREEKNKRSKRSVDSPVVQNTPEFAKQGAWSFSTKTCSKTLNVTKPQHHGPTEQAAPRIILSKPNQDTTKFLTQLPPHIRVFGKVRLHGATPLLCSYSLVT